MKRPLGADEVEQLIGELDRAMETGNPMVDVGGAEIPATPATRVALEHRLEALNGPHETEQGPEQVPAAELRGGPIILDTIDNLSG